MPHKDTLKSVLTKLNKKKTSPLGKFAEDFIVGLREQDFSEVNVGVLSEAVEAHYKLFKKHKKTPLIEITAIHNEETDRHETIIDIVSKDMSFIVDSVTAELADQGYTIETLYHPLTTTETSHIHIRLGNTLAKSEQKNLKERLNIVIHDVHLANTDFMQMKDKIRECQIALSHCKQKDQEDVQEGLAFLDYLFDDNFTLLGYREFSLYKKDGKTISRTIKSSSLGLLRNERQPIFLNKKEISLPQHLQDKRSKLPIVFVSKVNRTSTVHRKVPLDCVSIKLFDEDGSLKGEGIFIGLFTSVTYSRSLDTIPLFRKKAQNVLSKSEFKVGTHDYRSLRHILEKYPRDEFFQIEESELIKFARSIMKLYEKRKAALYVRKDTFGRTVSCLVYVPRERFETRLRLKFKDILEEAFKGEVLNFYVSIDDSTLARVLYVIDVEPFKTLRYNHAKIEKQIIEAAQSWEMQLFHHILGKTGDDNLALKLRQKYGNAFSTDYRNAYTPKQTYADIRRLEKLSDKKPLSFSLFNTREKDGRIRLKAYHTNTPLPLSRIFPVLENIGLKVESELPSKVVLDNGNTYWIHDFDMVPEDENFALENYKDIRDVFEKSLVEILEGAYEDDRFNQLVLKAGMTGEDILILRGYLRYIRQTNFTFSKTYTEDTLATYPEIAQCLIDIFHKRFDPAQSKDRQEKLEQLYKSFSRKMDKVTSYDHDQIIKTFYSCITNTLRTNYYQKDENGDRKSYFSFKLESGKIPTLPAPKPYREIFVYSKRVEGVHLRGDVIARGGIRWSDRHEDFRTEVLGLMKAQQVKNAIIVPMGAKGGFVVKNPPKGDRQALQKEGVECYKIFISGLLDITDNYKNDKVVKPKQVVCHDGDDPYLVVAADKGTASFSDTANAISKNYDFWLKDAFASGGSEGYDHKVMGITARGAWESVKRHFAEMGFNTQKQDFTVIGVGDMGGDVFGNGMLLSKHIKLIGAFNHLHIFCDPNPDPEKTWKERERLFKNVKGWDAYDTKLLSKGGRIFERSEKSLKLTKEIRDCFGIKAEEVSPNELMNAMLKAQTDLLWFGGIGTYIKATHEANSQVGDKSNDAIRVNATDLQAKVIGEGANLAVTQDARVEFAQNGGRINADFIDNSGGVDSSDHEVNIKILLNKIVDSPKSKFSIKERNKLLETMEENVIDLVLSHNYHQAQALSAMEYRAIESISDHDSFMTSLEETGQLDRQVENLPDSKEIKTRLSQNQGLTRPELAILSCYAKIVLTKDLVKTNIDETPSTHKWLKSYFPKALQKKFGKEIPTHQLSKEIIATILASSMINRFGPSYVRSLQDKGYSAFDIARSYLLVHDVIDLPHYWERIEGLEKPFNSDDQIQMLLSVSDTTKRMVGWLVKNLSNTTLSKDDVQSLDKATQDLKSCLMNVLPPHRKESIKNKRADYIARNVPEDLADDLAILSPMGAVFDIAFMAKNANVSVMDAAHIYYMIGEHYDLYWLRARANDMTSSNMWQEEALTGVKDQLYALQSSISRNYLDQRPKAKKGKGPAISEETLHEWCTSKDHCKASDRARERIESMKMEQSMSLSMFYVAIENLKELS